MHGRWQGELQRRALRRERHRNHNRSTGRAAADPLPAPNCAAAKASRHAAEARLKREEREDRESARAAKDAAVQRKKCDQLKLKKRWADEDARRATGPATEAARLRAHRAGEAMALECPR
jgi:hypothetical protein